MFRKSLYLVITPMTQKGNIRNLVTMIPGGDFRKLTKRKVRAMEKVGYICIEW